MSSEKLSTFCLSLVLYGILVESRQSVIDNFPNNGNGVNNNHNNSPAVFNENEWSLQSQQFYSFGARLMGDKLVAHTARYQFWPIPQDVRIVLNYPANGGTGYTVTYVNVSIDQSTKQGIAYITKGGISQNFITIVVESYFTTYVNYQVEIYGY